MKEATWTDGSITVTGHWEYYRPSDKFIITLSSKDPITKQIRVIETYRDVPEWGDFKRVEA